MVWLTVFFAAYIVLMRWVPRPAIAWLLADYFRDNRGGRFWDAPYKLFLLKAESVIHWSA